MPSIADAHCDFSRPDRLNVAYMSFDPLLPQPRGDVDGHSLLRPSSSAMLWPSRPAALRAPPSRLPSSAKKQHRPALARLIGAHIARPHDSAFAPKRSSALRRIGRRSVARVAGGLEHAGRVRPLERDVGQIASVMTSAKPPGCASRLTGAPRTERLAHQIAEHPAVIDDDPQGGILAGVLHDVPGATPGRT